MVEKKHTDSYDALAASIERVIRTDLAPRDSATHLAGSIDQLMLSEACAAELRLGYLRLVVVAPYAALIAWGVVRAGGTGGPPRLLLPALLSFAWLAGAATLVLGLRRSWFRRWMPRVAPFADATMILATFLTAWRLGGDASLPTAEAVGYLIAMCAFLALSGGLRLSRGAARAAMVLAVLVFLVGSGVVRLNAPAAVGIAGVLLATGLLSASVTTLIRRLVTDEVARATLSTMYQEAEAAIAAREQVLKIVSHDLRNPLHTISMCASLLQEVSMDPAKQGEQLTRIKGAGERMNRLIQDLLDVAKLEAGRIAIEARPIEVPALMREAHEMLTPIAAEKGIRLESSVDESVQAINADGGRVLQVLSNLVGNAIKFTPSGGRIVLRAESAPGGVRISVADTGEGIPPDQLAKIFGRFWQANPADRRGIGLGLSIAKGIVEGHGGRIWVESVVGKGTTFSFTLTTSLSPTSSGSRERRTVQEAAELLR